MYPRPVGYILDCDGRKCVAAKLSHDPEAINYYVKAWRNILDEQERIQHFKDQIKDVTPLLKQMSKPQPLTKHQFVIQQAQAELAIDRFVRTNHIPDKGSRVENVVGDIWDFRQVILDHHTLKGFDSETRKASLRNYLDISKSVAREDRKAHFEKIIDLEFSK